VGEKLHTELLDYEVLPSVRKKVHKASSFLLFCGMWGKMEYNDFKNSNTKHLRTIMAKPSTPAKRKNTSASA